MAKKFYAQKDPYGYPIPGTMMSTERSVPADSVEIPAEDVIPEYGQTVVDRPTRLRYFVRRDKAGNIIPNSLIISLKKPQGDVYEFKLIRGTAIPAPSALSYTTPNVYTTGQTITPLSPTVTGTVVTYSVSPALPNNLTLNTTTGVISGTVAGTLGLTTYTITATNPAGSTTAQIQIGVNGGE